MCSENIERKFFLMWSSVDRASLYSRHHTDPLNPLALNGSSILATSGAKFGGRSPCILKDKSSVLSSLVFFLLSLHLFRWSFGNRSIVKFYSFEAKQHFHSLLLKILS